MDKQNNLSSRREIVTALADFLLHLYQDADRYSYVSITERRFFNFFYTIFLDRPNTPPKSLLKKLVSNNGLLLQHKSLLTHYLAEGRFPSILLADDLAIHGRSMGKFLYQLEQAIIEDFRMETGAPLTKEERDMLHYQLISAVDIRVFAKSRNPILLEDGYAAKLKFDYNLYSDKLHQVTDLLSQSVSLPKIANTSFVLSARYRGMDDGNDGGGGAGPDLTLLPQARTSRNGWEYVPWISRWRDSGKKLHTYIRPRTDERGTYLISTVRFYESSAPLLTSYPIFSELDTRMLDRFDRTYVVLRYALLRSDSRYDALLSILADENPHAQQARGELLSTFLSIADLMEFCADYALPAGRIFQDTDVMKLAVNYGEKTSSAFSDLLQDTALCMELAAIIREGLRRLAVRMPFEENPEHTFPVYTLLQYPEARKTYILSLFGAEDGVSSEARENTFDILEQMAHLRIQMGAPQQSAAAGRLHDTIDHMCALASDHSRPEDGWEPVPAIALSDEFSDIPAGQLDRCKVIDFINDQLEREVYYLGMGSEANAYHYFDAPFLYRSDHFGDYVPGKADAALDSGYSYGVMPFSKYMTLCDDLPVSGYGRVAAYLALIDKGCIAGKIQYTQSTDTTYSICKAGERALFYLPQKFALFVPALAAVERGSLLTSLSPKEAVLRFVRNHLEYAGECRDIRTALLDLKTFIEEYLDTLSSGGQMFSGWNFDSLTSQKKPSHRAAQEEFVNQAWEFLQKEN